MTIRKTDLSSRVRVASALRDPIARREAILEMLDIVAEGHAEMDDLSDELVASLTREPSEEVLDFVWYRLGEMGPHEGLVVLAEGELASPVAHRRKCGLRYLARVRPQERRKLFERMRGDYNENVLYEAGFLALPESPRDAVQVWLSALPSAGFVLGDEMLPGLIGQYIEQPDLDRIEAEFAENPSYYRLGLVQAEASKWRNLDYPDAPEPPPVGDGYVIRCPGCDKRIGIREGHTGQRGRCRLCGKEFVIPARDQRR